MGADQISIVLFGALAGGFVSGLAGFGTGVTALGIWLYALQPPAAATLVIVCSVVAQIQTLPTIWYQIEPNRVMLFIVPGLLGVPLGTMLLSQSRRTASEDERWRRLNRVLNLHAAGKVPAPDHLGRASSGCRDRVCRWFAGWSCRTIGAASDDVGHIPRLDQGRKPNCLPGLQSVDPHDGASYAHFGWVSDDKSWLGDPHCAAWHDFRCFIRSAGLHAA
jgi:hypothetical protein